MGESSSKVACVASGDLGVFPVGMEKMKCLVYSVCWLAFMVCDGDLMMACDGFYDDGLVMTLWWFYDDDGLVVPCGGFYSVE